MTGISITEVRFTPAPMGWPDKSLLGWASCVVDDAMGVGGLAVRRTREGEITLSFPDPWMPDDQRRREFQSQVLGELERRGLIS